MPLRASLDQGRAGRDQGANQGARPMPFRAAGSRLLACLSARQIYEIGRNPGRFRRNLLRMIQYYTNQDIDHLYKASRKQLQGLRKKLLFQRNEKMANHFISLLSENTVFAAVGAAHLGGEKGMLRLVKKHGFKLKPILLMQ
jgi:hypothetical protein